MKKIILLFIPFLLMACNNNISYEIRNKTDYDVTVYDPINKNYPEYHVKAHTVKTIDHTQNAELALKNNSDPIEVENNFIYTEIKELKSYSLNVYNNSDKALVLKVDNTTHNSTASFNIAASSDVTLKIYANNAPVIKLYNSNTEYNNYTIRDNNVIIM